MSATFLIKILITIGAEFCSHFEKIWCSSAFLITTVSRTTISSLPKIADEHRILQECEWNSAHIVIRILTRKAAEVSHNHIASKL